MTLLTAPPRGSEEAVRGRCAPRSGAHGAPERMVEAGRFDPLPLITHRFGLDDIVEAYRVFSNRLDGVLKVAIRP